MFKISLMYNVFPNSKKRQLGALFLLLLIHGTSCIAPKRVLYFNDVPDTLTSPMVITHITPYIEPKILPNDILSVTIQTIEQNATNTPITTNSVGVFNPLNGLLVDKNGYIELSLIGYVKVGGLTTAEARNIIKEKAREYYKEPVVNCRISNFSVLMLGDVGKVGFTTFPDEKATILDAIGQAGDISLTGRKDNILLVRTEGDEKKFVRLNLNTTDIFQSPYFYLRQRDIIIVKPRNSKIRDSDNRFVKYIGMVSTVVSLTTLILAYRNYKF